jgi:hypothetical protein
MEKGEQYKAQLPQNYEHYLYRTSRDSSGENNEDRRTNPEQEKPQTSQKNQYCCCCNASH